jgi:ParB-like chromosome segregation protein Spo0J
MREIVQLPIKGLKLLDNNPRKITKDQFTKLCESIKTDPDYFLNRPCLINQVGAVFHVYAGNQRVKAAKQLGWKNVPCIVEKDLPEDVLHSRIIKDNKNYGDFDFDILANLYEIDTIIAAGFTAEELIGKVEEEVEVVEEKAKKEDPIKKCPHCDGIL